MKRLIPFFVALIIVLVPVAVWFTLHLNTAPQPIPPSNQIKTSEFVSLTLQHIETWNAAWAGFNSVRILCNGSVNLGLSLYGALFNSIGVFPTSAVGLGLSGNLSTVENITMTYTPREMYLQPGYAVSVELSLFPSHGWTWTGLAGQRFSIHAVSLQNDTLMQFNGEVTVSVQPSCW